MEYLEVPWNLGAEEWKHRKTREVHGGCIHNIDVMVFVANRSLICRGRGMSGGTLWYSWRHRILSLAASGYGAVAPDLPMAIRMHPLLQSYTYFHIVGDLVGLIDTLGQDKVFVAGHDWGCHYQLVPMLV
ncbi:hypothetical protein C5167_011964 [Papaver somniferum]|uniref:AB hydrolase-1 domain-containing protein n=1 Tax=Papaver somniferum TaxID=3469 RepID=A0A4Y7IZ89_PAPSO|nr:hypothetical protein C5167_011964 [Papaver somniferum]